MESNSKKTFWIVTLIVVLVIVFFVGYLLMQANKGSAPQPTQSGASSPDLGTGTQSSVSTGLNPSDLGSLNSSIDQLNQDINKL
ncbi:MAG: hypothetical protein M1155_02915 [Patescibacteria group bacterium]|nr:hypothetical protein [Patescibacteria group bacterium]